MVPAKGRRKDQRVKRAPARRGRTRSTSKNGLKIKKGRARGGRLAERVKALESSRKEARRRKIRANQQLWPHPRGDEDRKRLGENRKNLSNS